MSDDESPLAATEVHYIASDHVGDEFKLFVGHCGTADSDLPAPVLYITDANGFFGSAVDIIRSMQLARHLPPILVVGIGYRCGALAEAITIRTRDMTPSVDAGFVKLFPEHEALGGAPALLAFILNRAEAVGRIALPSRPERRNLLRPLPRWPLRNLRVADCTRDVPTLRDRQSVAVVGQGSNFHV